MYGRYLNNLMSYIHFWITMIGAYLIFWPMHYEGFAGMPAVTTRFHSGNPSAISTD
jgi:heme/copper-type cytochrome/quinol oxidase subunit 1